MTATILVADDDAPIVDVVAAVLEDEGYTVLRAYDGAEALAQFERDGLDLLVTDNMMPKLSGVELIDRVQARPDRAVPVILMSAVIPARMPPRVTFLPKPFDLDDLARIVDGLLAAT